MVVVRPVPLPVRCLNCGGGDSLGTWSLIVAILALVVAGIALYITWREHREFMNQLGARARFELTIDLEDASGDLIELSPKRPEIVLRIGLKNVGDRAARDTTVNVLAPDDVTHLVWSNQIGTQLSSPDDAARTGESLKFSSGATVAASWITKTIPRVTLRTPLVTWFTVVSPGSFELPIRVYAESDDLPDDEEQATCERTFRIRWTR